MVNRIADLPARAGLRRRHAASTATWSQAGIIDPVKVTKSAVSNAASIAGMVLTTASTVVGHPGAGAARRRAAHHGHSH